MAPGILVETPTSGNDLHISSEKDVKSRSATKQESTVESYTPLEPTGALDGYTMSQVTPTMGMVVDGLNVHDILRSDKCDSQFRDLAILAARRGVCILPKQDNLTIEDEKLLCMKLGELTYRPSTSGLHIHPINQTELADGTIEPSLTTLAGDPKKKLMPNMAGFGGDRPSKKKQSRIDGWHTDSAYEPIPADFTLLHMKETPPAGGDTLFASAYEMYDILSEPFAKFLETRTATFMPHDHRPENIIGRMWDGPRGAPENVGAELRASHSVVRTNPITGWKALYAAGHHVEGIDDLGQEESDMIVHFLDSIITNNHQLQMRVHWEPNTLVLWDNRACFHCATFDVKGLGKRSGNRICGCGEKPYLDPQSTGRRYALGLPNST